MSILAEPVALAEILPWRDLYRREMSCQIVHDSLHEREGWAREYRLSVGGTPAGYGSVVVGGPWKDRPAIFEFYVLPRHRVRTFDLFEALLSAAGATAMDVQSNDPLLFPMLHLYATSIESEKVLFRDEVTTMLPGAAGAIFRAARPDEIAIMESRGFDRLARYVVETGGEVVAAGGALFHYNRPYGDVFMAVAEPQRRRGLGSFVAQELKRVCYEGGSIPAARCSPGNVASRQALQRAGFVPCGHILTGVLKR